MRLLSLGLDTAQATARWAAYAFTPTLTRLADAPFAPGPGDRRFRDPAWRVPPFDALMQAQLARENLWRRATEPTPGVRAHHVRRVRFMGEQALHAMAPSNAISTNPVVIDAIAKSGGRCLIDGLVNLTDDIARLASGQRFFGAEAYEVGVNLANTPGAVVYRNELIELIQYAPTTPNVRAEPVLIVSAWIMKYYILDLSPQNSLIRYLVDQGFTVFCISWKNPDASDRNLTLDHYRTMGVLAALDAVNAIVPNQPVHAAGYCLGGTILAIAAAGIQHESPRQLKSLTLLAAQIDFSEAGELMMFIDESQIAALEDIMNVQGYLDARQMAGAFYALRANDLLWERIVERYLLGRRKPAGELDAWLSDATRMPARMHSEYLRLLFLENRLAQGNLEVDSLAVSLKDLQLPIFAVGAERDHIAPWRSVHKIALFATAETTFVLSGGGHNSAIVSPPDKPGAYFRIKTAGDCDTYLDTDEWLAAAPLRQGSWWTAWREWLVHRSAPALIGAPTSLGAEARGYPPLDPAPGRYVLAC